MATWPHGQKKNSRLFSTPTPDAAAAEFKYLDKFNFNYFYDMYIFLQSNKMFAISPTI